jgi:hypothetical protein
VTTNKPGIHPAAGKGSRGAFGEGDVEGADDGGGEAGLAGHPEDEEFQQGRGQGAGAEAEEGAQIAGGKNTIR